MRTVHSIAEVKLVEMRCWCGLPHAIPSELASMYDRTGRECYCPLGHSYIPADKGENALLRRQLQEAQDATARAEAAARRERDAHIATKGQLTKTKKRLTAGVCPCCRRNFVALGEHMRKQHPDYVQETA